jgi:osmotically-inducible protein OsmY
MSDIQLRQNILDALEFEPSIDAAHIGVAVEKGVATLTGHVGSYAAKTTAERIVQRVKGVRGVAQEIQVRYPANKKCADDEIAQRALQIIAWDVELPDGVIQVKVQNGWITLTGQVDWHYQRADAEAAVRRLSGVMGITNSLAIRSRPDARDIKRRIEEALKRHAEVEASGIRVNVDGGKVRLDGKVQAWYERAIAEQAAWAVSGVNLVEDHLKVA